MTDRRNPEKPETTAAGDIPFPEELVHLSGIREKLDTALLNAEKAVESMDQEYMELRRYMSENRAEIDPHEMFQSELQLSQTDQQGGLAMQSCDRVKKLIDSPYFSRIDFCKENQQNNATFYIGRFAFSHEKKLLISDWRSPVASMFYDCEVGAAGYDAPAGRVDGELTRKRQFRIKNGMMEYALESSVNIQDDILQQELSRTSDEKMKSIIATIQKEQNQIIRNEKAHTMIIQGVAGSGKTSIALHRIAYLLYRFKNRLTAKNVTIISPNRVFGDFISNVLPELGEEPIYELSLFDVADVQLENIIDTEVDRDPLETDDATWAERVQFKSTTDFVTLMDNYVHQLPNTAFEAADYTYEPFTATAEYIHNRFHAYTRQPVMERLKMVADDILDRFETDNIRENKLPTLRNILSGLKKMLRLKNTLALYKDFYRQLGMPKMLIMPDKHTLEWADVYPFMYLHAAFHGLQRSYNIRHLVIDEMQDYSPIQYAVLNLIFPCPKTILGDFSQTVNPNHFHTLADLENLYGDAELIRMTKSYRSSYEIIDFAKRIGAKETPDPVERHGEKPQYLSFEKDADMLEYVEREVKTFPERGQTSFGIITKTNRRARELYELLKERYDVHAITPDSKAFPEGIAVLSIQMSKGLEFDEVLLPDVDEENYCTESDRSLLYIACTRAMHRLTLLHAGEPTGLLADE